MKIAFLILAHKNPAQLQRLISRLVVTDCTVFLHVDRGCSRQTYDEMRRGLSSYSSLVWLPRCYSHGGSFGLVRATLRGLQRAYEVGADYVVLLSGQDYPVKPMSALVEFLDARNGVSFIDYHGDLLELWGPGGLARVQWWYFNLAIPESRLRRMLNRGLGETVNRITRGRRLPVHIQPFGGSQWWCLHKSCVDYVLHYTAANPHFTNYFKYVHVSDEIFFQTILLNSPFRDQIENRLVTYMDWGTLDSQRTLCRDDFDTLRQTDHFLARKFDTEYDSSILDMIDERLLDIPV